MITLFFLSGQVTLFFLSGQKDTNKAKATRGRNQKGGEDLLQARDFSHDIARVILRIQQILFAYL